MLYKITVEKIFTIETLSANNRKKVFDNFRYINVEDNGWYEDILEQWKEKLEKMGFIAPDIHFTGFWSQGDGASFTANEIDLITYLKVHKLCKQHRSALHAARQGRVRLAIVRDKGYRYVHEYTMRIMDEILDIKDVVQAQINGLCDQILNTARQLAKQLYQELEKLYEYAISDESIMETLQMNNYKFNVSGDVI